VKSVKDLEGKRIATEVVNLTKKYLTEKRRVGRGEIFLGRDRDEGARYWWTRSSKSPRPARALRANKLRIVDDCLSSTPRLIANTKPGRIPGSAKKSRRWAMLLKGALDAEAKVGLKMNIAEKNLKSLLRNLPALRNPTISNLSLKGWVAVETIIDEHIARELIPQLKAAGAEGIIDIR